MHYCSAQRIAPTEVTDAVFDEFKRALVEESLVAHPLRDHQTACRLWNQMRREITGWPDVSVTVPRYQLTYGIDWEQLHPRLLEEIEAYFAKLENPDLFDSDGPTRPLSPRSLKTMRGNIGRYLGALERSGVDIGELTSLSQIVDVGLFKLAMEWLWQRNDGKPSQGLRGIVWTIRCIAIKWCRVDDETAAQYRAIVRKLRADQHGLSDKNDALLQQFDNPDLERCFLRVPLALWQIVNRRHNELGAHRTALLAQIAVAIEILQFAPMRARNLLEITMEDHLNFYMDGDAEAVHITIPAEAVKNRERLSFTLPAEVSQRIKTYLDHHRPVLAKGPNRYLFPGRNGSHKDQSAVFRQITRAVWDHAGVRVTPHQFRHIAAKLLLDANPGAYELVRKLLGHKSTSMVYECYSGRETKAAGRIYNDIVLGGRDNDGT